MAGLPAVEESSTKLEFARLSDVPGASLVTGMRLPNLAAIWKEIAVAVDGPSWSQVRQQIPNEQSARQDHNAAWKGAHT